jgi:predicted transcriptional regulator
MKRSKIEMFCAVLKAVRDSSRGLFYGKMAVAKCRMARKAGLNIQFFTEALNFLVAKNFLEEDTTGNRSSFKLTDRGREWLNSFEKCQNALDISSN